MAARTALLIAVLVTLAGAALAQAPDTILLGGKIVTLDAATPLAQALAVRDGRIVAVDTSAAVRRLAGPDTRVIDLDGRTVIPGLIDSHIHAIRAGLTYSTEVSWIGAGTLAEAMRRLNEAAATAPPDAWLIVAGGWSERQFAERRRPTQSEIAAAAPGRNIYIQLFYSAVLLSPGGADALGIAADPALVDAITVERDESGRPTGWLSGDNRAISGLFDRLPRPRLDQQIAGTRAFFRTLNSLGLTGVIDPGGYNMPIDDYQALFSLWRDRGLTLRVVYSLCAPRRGHELQDFHALTAALPMGFGDDWLSFNGIGENVTWGMYNNEHPSAADKDTLFDVLSWAAARGLSATFHWQNDRSVGHLLDVLERVDRLTPIASLRWSIAHLNDASVESLTRMKALGVGWLMQNAFYFRGEAFLGQRGLEAARLAPPIVTAGRMGVVIGGGTDAHRVMSYNPFVSLQWMLDGKTVAGVAMRGAEELPTREEALRLYTSGSAWFAFAEANRGALTTGRLADLAVLSADYLSVPTAQIGTIRSLLTMVGDRIVYADGPYASLDERR